MYASNKSAIICNKFAKIFDKFVHLNLPSNVGIKIGKVTNSFNNLLPSNYVYR